MDVVAVVAIVIVAVVVVIVVVGVLAAIIMVAVLVVVLSLLSIVAIVLRALSLMHVHLPRAYTSSDCRVFLGPSIHRQQLVLASKVGMYCKKVVCT